ncbi:MAG: YdiL family protein [Burkholderiales bacterium]|jgi:hypothetical protein|nr:YdiL family protein [Burkholderiales bacterium]
MQALKFKLARESLFYSVEEAATLVGKVDVAIWRAWEEGNAPIPESVHEKMIDLIGWRRSIMVKFFERGKEDIAQGVKPGSKLYVTFWYERQEDFIREQNMEAIYHRPMQSAFSEIGILMQHEVALIPYDEDEFTRFLDGRERTREIREEWDQIKALEYVQKIKQSALESGDNPPRKRTLM